MYIVLGKNGFMAEAFISELKRRKVDYIALSRSDIDYTNFKEFSAYLEINFIKFGKIKIINCAGYVGKPNVDACELNKSETILGNIIFPSMLSNLCIKKGIELIHVSSGCIYNGTNNGLGFSEDDAPNFSFDQNNCSFYSGSKAVCEEVLRSNPWCYIFRLRVPFDHIDSPRNYISKCLSYDTLLNVENSVTHRFDYAKYCLDLMNIKAPYGTYNICNKGSITTEFVVDLIKKYLKPNKVFKYFEDEEAFSSIIETPRSTCIMDTSKIENLISIRSSEDAIIDCLKNWNP
jgi:dTDP-4-dehydrorhamnose reductase